MISKWLATAFLTAVITGPASTQTTNATSHQESESRGSSSLGLICNQANEKIGDVNDVILDRSARSAMSSSGWVAFSATASAMTQSPSIS